MSKLTNKEKQILTYIVTNCELYYLNESEAMMYIEDNLGRAVSRRTYYNYKRRIYSNYEKDSNYSEALKMSQPQLFKKYCKPFLTLDKITLFRKGLKEKINLEKYDRLTFIPRSYSIFQTSVAMSIESLEKSHSRLKSELETERSHIPIPNIATVREEFVKCGKLHCHGCPHGPYYYAYWRDEKRKLRKKYLGVNKPRITQEKSDNNLLALHNQQPDNSLLNPLRKQEHDDDILNLLRKQEHDDDLLDLMRDS
jgi:hypothetical protein